MSSSSSSLSSIFLKQVKDFYNAETAKNYNSMMPQEMPKVQVDLDYLLQHLERNKNNNNNNKQPKRIVLDACCGTGDMLLWLYDATTTTTTTVATAATGNDKDNDENRNVSSSSSYYSWIGNDLSSDMLKIAKEKLAPRSITWLEGSMEQLGSDNNSIIQDQSCIAVLCNFAIHHVQEYQPILKELTRVLCLPTTTTSMLSSSDDGGLLYLSFWEGHGQQEEENGLAVYYHDAEKVKETLKEYGYQIEQERSVDEEIFEGFSMKARYILATIGTN